MKEKVGLFGTDGIRDLANQGALTPAMLVRIGAALGEMLTEGARRDPLTVLIGEDGRASGQMIRFALSAGLLGKGIQVVNGGLMPTPALALITTLRKFTAGVMISASHNPAHHNGIKVFGPDGEKIPDEQEARVEDLVAAHWRDNPRSGDPERTGVARRDESVVETYSRYLVAELNPDLYLGSYRLVLDCANGGASRVAPRILEELGAGLHVCNDQPDGANINQKCGSLNADLLAQVVRGEKANLGICLDGDGDRCILLDENGAVVDGDRILLVLARHLKRQGRLPGDRVVCTVMSNLGLLRALRTAEIEAAVTPVGDRQVTRAMRDQGAALGGEQSGHIVLARNGRLIGDGLVTGLEILQAMKATGLPLSRLAGDFRPYPQVLVNVSVREKPPLESLPAVTAAVRKAEAALGEEGRIVIRFSGTEMLGRVMVEGPEEELVKEMARTIADALRETLG